MLAMNMITTKMPQTLDMTGWSARTTWGMPRTLVHRQKPSTTRRRRSLDSFMAPGWSPRTKCTSLALHRFAPLLGENARQVAAGFAQWEGSWALGLWVLLSPRWRADNRTWRGEARGESKIWNFWEMRAFLFQDLRATADIEALESRDSLSGSDLRLTDNCNKGHQLQPYTFPASKVKDENWCTLLLH